MKPKDVLRWAATTIAVLLLAGIGFCGMRGMFKLYNSTVVLTPQTGESLIVLVVASMSATIVVALSNVRTGTFQFSGLGINFKGLACQATIWVVVFVSFSVAFLAVMKCVA